MRMMSLLLLTFCLQFSIAQKNTDTKGPITTMEFNTTEFYFGTVVEGEKIQNVFTFTNTGDEPLIIINAKGSCGCTVPRFPKDPILPGESANLLVQFDSKNKGKVGGAKQSKRVTITANTETPNTYLTIKGSVEKKAADDSVGQDHGDFDINADAVILYPNPTQNEINLKLNDFIGKSVQVEIYDNSGKLVHQKKISKVEASGHAIDVSQLQYGNHTMSINIEGKNRIAKQFVRVGGE